MRTLYILCTAESLRIPTILMHDRITVNYCVNFVLPCNMLVQEKAKFRNFIVYFIHVYPGMFALTLAGFVSLQKLISILYLPVFFLPLRDFSNQRGKQL